MNRARNILLGSAVAVISVLLTLAAAEVLLQVRHRRNADPTWSERLHRPSSIAGLSYELAPNRERLHLGVPVRVNSFGLRDDEAGTSADSRVRIAVLGDSFTFGFGVPGEHTYPNVLEHLLDEAAGDQVFDVLNFGVGGYSTRDESLLLRHRALGWDPELIVVGYFLNDPEIEPWQPLHRFYRETEHWWERTELFELASRALRDWRVREHGSDYYEYLHDQEGHAWRSVVQSFAEMRDAASSREIPLLLVIFPDTRDAPWSDYPYEHLHRQVIRAATENGFEIIDLLEKFSSETPAALMVAPGDSHPSERAHELAATAIFEWLESTDRLPGLLESAASASPPDGRAHAGSGIPTPVDGN